MSDYPVPCVGCILSADIAVPEHERELRFYSRVLTTGERPLWRDDLMNNQGTPIIGLGPRAPEYEQLPLQWMPHIQVADVAMSAERAVQLGGTELMHGKDDEGNSQWTVLLDPNGAAFGIIPVVPADAVPAQDGPTGRITWLDLTVADAPAVRDFYREVIGWSVEDSRMSGSDGNEVAEVRAALGDDEGVPPVWLLHLPVGDLAASVDRVREEGGEILADHRGGDREPARVVIQDPVGACFALVQG